MAIIASGKRGDYTPPPVGNHQAVCVDVIDLGIEETQWGKKHKIRIRWQINERMDNGERFSVSKKYTLSLSDRANLHADLVSWRGKAFTDSELDGFDLEKVIGANCMVNIVKERGTNGKDYTVVKSIAPLVKGLPRMDPDNYTREVDRDGYQPPQSTRTDDDSLPPVDGYEDLGGTADEGYDDAIGF